MHIFIILSIIFNMLSTVDTAYSLPYPIDATLSDKTFIPFPIENALSNKILILNIPNIMLDKSIITDNQLTEFTQSVKSIIESAEKYIELVGADDRQKHLTDFTDALQTHRGLIIHLNTSHFAEEFNLLDTLKELNIYIPSIIYTSLSED